MNSYMGLNNFILSTTNPWIFKLLSGFEEEQSRLKNGILRINNWGKIKSICLPIYVLIFLTKVFNLFSNLRHIFWQTYLFLPYPTCFFFFKQTLCAKATMQTIRAADTNEVVKLIFRESDNDRKVCNQMQFLSLKQMQTQLSNPPLSFKIWRTKSFFASVEGT